jgi:chromosome segregation ATPase
VEDRLRRVEGNVENVANTLESRGEIYSLWEEKQELRMVEFEKKWREWHTEFEDFQQKAEDVDERIIKYDENYRALSQTRADLDKIIEKLERRISEISEMQRFNEERIKQEWTSYQADDQKRWNTYKLTNDELWRDHTRIHEKITHELHAISERLDDGILAIEELGENSQQRVMDLFTTVSNWAESIDKKVSEMR